ncbi:hypothetical protein PUNSTDRAFT_141918 [Punctularia strigosozonata HHB-11173 SS5]|uniref:uncharacterized protein n=1 Tax=Punctularia strigosozonata (strain HHB-11173) TaxID=741275 RepID=UPI00044186FD|nr:uncharacterized protein PUNSTDRAFT_141918 [Punctularia strigosozonata HHB-11173 SS5]EIN11607.1 hypothetical protein PUNSTDRAFT_141918 [Punctularia strigosozonata HHB-11173 SS5]
MPLVLDASSSCDICLEEYTYEDAYSSPHAIPCGHVFCLTCIESFDPETCPFCRKSFNAQTIRKLQADCANPQSSTARAEDERGVIDALTTWNAVLAAPNDSSERHERNEWLSEWMDNHEESQNYPLQATLVSVMRQALGTGDDDTFRAIEQSVESRVEEVEREWKEKATAERRHNEALEDGAEELFLRVATAESQLSSTQEDLERVQHELRDTKASLSQTRNRLVAAETDVTDLRREVQNVSEARDTTVDRNLDLTAQLAYLQQTRDAETANMAHQLDTVNQDLRDVRSEVHGLRVAAQRSDELEIQFAAARTELERSRAASQIGDAEKAALEAQVHRLRGQLSGLQTIQEQEAARVRDGQLKLAEAHARLSHYEQLFSRGGQVVNDLQAKLAAAHSDNESLRTQLQHAEHSRAVHEASVTELQTQLRRQDSEIGLLRSQPNGPRSRDSSSSPLGNDFATLLHLSSTNSGLSRPKSAAPSFGGSSRWPLVEDWENDEAFPASAPPVPSKNPFLDANEDFSPGHADSRVASSRGGSSPSDPYQADPKPETSLIIILRDSDSATRSSDTAFVALPDLGLPSTAPKLTHSTSVPLDSSVWESQRSSGFTESTSSERAGAGLPNGAAPPDLAFRRMTLFGPGGEEQCIPHPPSLTPAVSFPGTNAATDDSFIPTFRQARSVDTPNAAPLGSAPLGNRWTNSHMQPPYTHSRTASEPLVNLRTTPLHLLERVSGALETPTEVSMPGAMPANDSPSAGGSAPRVPTEKKSMGETMRKLFGRKH